MTWHRACTLASLAEGLPIHIVLGDRPVMLLLQRDVVHATDAVCPHKFTLLTDGEVHDGAITCPMHEATFDLETGKPQEGCEWAGTLPIHETKVDADDVFVRL